MKDELKDMLSIALCGISLFALVIALALGLVAYECSGYSEVTGKETKMQAMSCYIKDDGHWYQWEEYKYRLATKGEFAK